MESVNAPLKTHRIGRTALEVTRLGMGCAPLGDLFEVLPDAQAIDAIDAAYAGGIRFFDTAPWYGTGKSELRTGFGLRGKADVVVATKVGRVLTRGGSLQPSQRWKGGLPFGVIFDYTYAGINRTGLMPKFLERFELDYFIVAMPYTLLSQEGLQELDLCRQRGVSVIIGAPFASGLLVSGSSRPATYDYAAAPPEMVEKTARLEAVCAAHQVPLPAAALQFVLAHPAVASVIPGYNSPGQAEGCLQWLRTPIAPEFWEGLRVAGLIDTDAPTPA